MNVGLMMMCKRYRWIRVALHIDEARLRVLAPRGDLRRLRTQLSVFTLENVPSADLPVEERYRWMAAVKSAVIQTSPSHPGILITDSGASKTDICSRLDTLFDTLFTRLILC